MLLRLLLLTMLCSLVVPVVRADEASPTDDAPAVVGDAGAAEPVAAAPITGQNCLGDPRPKAVMNQLLGIKYGDWGLEHQVRVGACVPLWKRKGVLFDLSALEAGFVMHTSPIYVMPGAYLRFQPLSILGLVVEAAPIAYWPIGVDGAGYYPIDNYSSDYSRESLPGEDGGTAKGWYVRFGPNLQLAAPLGPLRLIILDTLRFEHYQLGTADFYFHNRNDLPAAKSDWFIDNMAILLVEFPLSRNLLLRVGANDQTTFTIGGKALSNSVRGVAMLTVPKLGKRVRDLTPMVAIGGRTNHPVRQGDFNFIFAFSVNVELSKLPQESE